MLVGIVFAAALAANAPVHPISKPPTPTAVELSGTKKTDATSDQKDSYGDQRGTQSAPLFVKIVPSEDADKPADKGHGPENNEASEEGGLVFPTWVLAVATVLLFAFTAALWKSTSNLVKSERAHAERELRAYISVEPDGINRLRRDTGEPEAIGHVLVRNVGKLPAQNVQVVVKSLLRGDRIFTPSGCPDDVVVQRTIQPGAHMRQGSKDYLAVNSIIQARNYTFIWGIVRYDDGYGIRRYTRFCHRYSGASRSELGFGDFVVQSEKARYHTDGNDSD